MIIVFGIILVIFSSSMYDNGIDLGWLYLFMGILVGSAVMPLWNLMMWKKASGTGAVLAAWGGLFLALTSWITTARVVGEEITVATLGSNEAMLIGNLTAILSSGFIHWAWSTFVDPNDYDFDTMKAVPSSSVADSSTRTGSTTTSSTTPNGDNDNR
jgi:urea-proton symporter